MSASHAVWAVEALVASSLLMVAVLLLRGPVRRAFGAQVAYALWALPVLRLVLPSVPAEWRAAAATPLARASETVTVLVMPVTHSVAAETPTVVAATPITLGAAIALAWAVGAALFLGWHVAAHRQFCRRVLGSAVPVEERDGVRVVASAAAAGPLAFGIWRRYVAFPRDFAERYDADERALALDHELGHHARGDLLANWIALAVLALHWWNPLAWRAFRAFRADQELANDARVLAGRSRADRHIYACAIVKAAHGGAVSAACHLHTIEDLKGRLRMLTVSRFSRRRLATGAATVSLLGVLGLGVTVSGSQAAAVLTDRVGTTVEAELARPIAAVQTPPAPPAAPAAPAAAPSAAPAPRPPAAPAAPAAAPAANGAFTSVTTADGKTTRVHVVRRGPGGVDMSKMVNITSADCGPDNGKKAFVVTSPGEGGAKITTICTDRITAAAMAGTMTEADGHNIERQALTAALSGLQASRASIAANRDMSAEQRAEALAGIDEALKEVQGDLAEVGKD